MDRRNGCTKCVWPIQTIKPYAKYTFTVACSFDLDFGPAVSTEVTSKEAGKVTHIKLLYISVLLSNTLAVLLFSA